MGSEPRLQSLTRDAELLAKSRGDLQKDESFQRAVAAVSKDKRASGDRTLGVGKTANGKNFWFI